MVTIRTAPIVRTALTVRTVRTTQAAKPLEAAYSVFLSYKLPLLVPAVALRLHAGVYLAVVPDFSIRHNLLSGFSIRINHPTI